MSSRFSSLLPAYKKEESIFHSNNFEKFTGDQTEVPKSNSVPEKINGKKIKKSSKNRKDEKTFISVSP